MCYGFAMTLSSRAKGEGRSEEAELLRRALKNHDAIAASLRSGIGNPRLFRAIDDMSRVKIAAAAIGCYPAPSAVLRSPPVVLMPDPGRSEEGGRSDESVRTLPDHLAVMGGWVEIPGLGWLREWPDEDVAGAPPLGFWWWHDCTPLRHEANRDSLRSIDTSSGERHAITGGSLHGGDLTIHGGSGSIPCSDCGLHGWVRNGQWVPA